MAASAFDELEMELKVACFNGELRACEWWDIRDNAPRNVHPTRLAGWAAYHVLIVGGNRWDSAGPAVMSGLIAFVRKMENRAVPNAMALAELRRRVANGIDEAMFIDWFANVWTA